MSGTCEDLAGKISTLANTRITASRNVTADTLKIAGQDVPEHCLVEGKMFERVSPVDGLTYAICFEMRLPVNWNGRFFYQANGGIDGYVLTAAGSFGDGPLTHALMQGFAVLSSDAGHPGDREAAFGIDPQARLDYGYQAVGKLTPMAKNIIEAAYGKKPDRSYIGGCSNGGRHTLVAAARYADQYDGYLAGAPGLNIPKVAVASILGAQRPAKEPYLSTHASQCHRNAPPACHFQKSDRGGRMHGHWDGGYNIKRTAISSGTGDRIRASRRSSRRP